MVPQNVRLLNRNKPEESGQMHTQEQERTQKDVENEDLLINQIDEFREKAKQLQVLLEAKESKAAELQSLVDERAGKAQELEHILTERQEEADKIVTEFGRKVDALAEYSSRVRQAFCSPASYCSACLVAYLPVLSLVPFVQH